MLRFAEFAQLLDEGLRDDLNLIRAAGGRRLQLQMTYLKKTDGTLVSRRIRPYEIARKPYGVVVWATDNVHGPNQIHSFLARNIQNIQATEKGFRPVWDVQLTPRKLHR
jgi:hypothetical protein